jgi:hypothetical protein
MPEFQGIKITQAEYSSRLKYSKALDKAVRTASKGSNWRCKDGLLFCEAAGWTFSVSHPVTIFYHATGAELRAKPMGVDSIFWRINDLAQNETEPLSFRWFGAWTCPVPEIDAQTIDEAGNVETVAGRIMEWSNVALAACKSFITQTKLIEVMQQRPEYLEHGTYLPTIVCCLALMGEEAEAMELCRIAAARKWSGGFQVSKSSFTDLAIAWLEGRSAPARRH